MLRRTTKKIFAKNEGKNAKKIYSHKKHGFHPFLPEKTDVYTSSNVKMQNKKNVIKNAVFLFLNIPPRGPFHKT